MSRRELKVDLFQNGNLLLPGLVLDYGEQLGNKVDIVQLVRCKLTDPKPNVQIYIADEKCGGEINWAPYAVQSENLMTKQTLDILSTKYVVINTVHMFGRNFPTG